MPTTLPLFAELQSAAAPVVSDPAPSATAADQRRESDLHLRAAWRLSRTMRRLPDHSEEQTRVGIAICRHLQALLAQSEQSEPHSGP